MEIKDLFEYDRGTWWRELDWVPVVSVDLGGGYDWNELHAWYSPSQRVYYWGSGSGCSCNSWREYFSSVADFENGQTRADLMAGIGRYFDDQYRDYPTDRVAALAEANAFSPKGK